jgi:hypothetical protein
VFNHHWFWKRVTHGTKAPTDMRVSSITVSKVGQRPQLSFVEPNGGTAPGMHAPGMHAPVGVAPGAHAVTPATGGVVGGNRFA